MISVGHHRLLCGDLTDGAVSRLMGDERADVIYSDPPWGPGNQKYWHTQRERGAAPRTSWPDFLAAFARAVAAHRKPTAPVFVEMGLRWLDDLTAAMREVGLPLMGDWHITYGPTGKPLPNRLMVFGVAVDVAIPVPPHGEPITNAALSAVVNPGDIVLDPCTGLGMTARITHALGGRFRGCEMNAARLAHTEAWLRKRVAVASRRVQPSPEDRVYTVRWTRSRKCLAADPLTRWRWSEPSQAEQMTLAEASDAAAKMGGIVCIDGVAIDKLDVAPPKKPLPLTHPKPMRDVPALVRGLMASARWESAFRAALKIRRLDEADRRALEAALQAVAQPDFCRQVRMNPDTMRDLGIAILRRLFEMPA